MSMMLAQTFKAFKEAGVSDEDAIGAATELAEYKQDISEIKTDLKILKWSTGLILIAVFVPLFKSFFPW